MNESQNYSMSSSFSRETRFRFHCLPSREYIVHYLRTTKKILFHHRNQFSRFRLLGCSLEHAFHSRNSFCCAKLCRLVFFRLMIKQLYLIFGGETFYVKSQASLSFFSIDFPLSTTNLLNQIFNFDHYEEISSQNEDSALSWKAKSN